MNKPALKALLEALQNAKEGSPELDERCLRAAGYTGEENYSRQYFPGSIEWRDPSGRVMDIVPRPTRNTQDALDYMVPDDCWLLLNHRRRTRIGDAKAQLSRGGTVYTGYGVTDSLAIVTACIKLELDKRNDLPQT